MEKGVISFDNFGVIETYNENARHLLDLNSDYVGRHIEEVLPKKIFLEYMDKKSQLTNKLIKTNDKNITISIYPIADLYSKDGTGVINGSYAILESFELQEDAQNKLRLQLADKGHIAKYSVDDIIGESKAVYQVRGLVKRMGNSKSAVLITGESGTGKELIAQAIHNSSPIKNKQFVAINCAALSPNLLESELFGYESGAFTGALKNGKTGIFELAHGGTLFLDEIGEMPLELQVRLLRVIQEKEVMRVGGNKIIKVDVRIVAATNKDLYDQVRIGNFRKDLYYRLNVLPINVPPLREREDDVFILLEYFKKEHGYNFNISPEIQKYLKTYNWEGNIRELKNCVEYFDNLGTDVFSMEQLPFHMRKKNFSKPSYKSEIYVGLNEKESYILNKFYEAFKLKKKLGRKSLSNMAFEENMFLSEYDIRAIMMSLKNLGYIDVESGRGGSTISKNGIEIVEKN
jgi:transcriptional regulator with PAS, ATPase and Fis domain